MHVSGIFMTALLGSAVGTNVGHSNLPINGVRGANQTGVDLGNSSAFGQRSGLDVVPIVGQRIDPKAVPVVKLPNGEGHNVMPDRIGSGLASLKAAQGRRLQGPPLDMITLDELERERDGLQEYLPQVQELESLAETCFTESLAGNYSDIEDANVPDVIEACENDFVRFESGTTVSPKSVKTTPFLAKVTDVAGSNKPQVTMATSPGTTSDPCDSIDPETWKVTLVGLLQAEGDVETFYSSLYGTYNDETDPDGEYRSLVCEILVLNQQSIDAMENTIDHLNAALMSTTPTISTTSTTTTTTTASTNPPSTTTSTTTVEKNNGKTDAPDFGSEQNDQGTASAAAEVTVTLSTLFAMYGMYQVA